MKGAGKATVNEFIMKKNRDRVLLIDTTVNLKIESLL